MAHFSKVLMINRISSYVITYYLVAIKTLKFVPSLKLALPPLSTRGNFLEALEPPLPGDKLLISSFSAFSMLCKHCGPIKHPNFSSSCGNHERSCSLTIMIKKSFAILYGSVTHVFYVDVELYVFRYIKVIKPQFI